MAMNSKLCDLCQVVIDIDAVIYGEHNYPYHADAQSLKLSAERGCPLCAIVWGSYIQSEHFKDFDTSQSIDKVYFTYKTYDYQSHHKWWNFRVAKTGSMDGDSFAFVRASQIDASETYLPRKATGTTGDMESLRQVSQWIEDCRENHPKCNPNTNNSNAAFTPKRLVYVGTLKSPELRLHEPGSSIPYVTLSHCWGQIAIKQLKSTNIDRLKQSIKATELTKTFREAIEASRMLGIQYLWIDSLCIIQDSTEDWQEQSGLMGEIYRNGYCNLAATSAPDGRAGLFFPRHPFLGHCVKLKHRDGGSGLYVLVEDDFWNQGVNNTPLNKRGWVLQERILSPRVVHFGKYQLYWECHELDASEMFPQGMPDILYAGRFKNTNGATIRQQMKDPPERIRFQSDSEEVDQLYLWNKYVGRYSQTYLTKDDDKLVAISAIARQIQSHVNDEYLAGMWRRRLPEHLLWYISASSPERQRPRVYCAPSWSWASINAGIKPYNEFSSAVPKVKIQILEAKIQLRHHANVFGQVSGGYLKIRGWLRAFTLNKLKDQEKDRLRIFLIRKEPETSNYRSGSTWAYFDERQSREASDWFCMPILERRKAYDGIPEDVLEIRGLILQPTGIANEYRRAGLFIATNFDRFAFSVPNYPAQDNAVVDDEGQDPLRLSSSSDDGLLFRDTHNRYSTSCCCESCHIPDSKDCPCERCEWPRFKEEYGNNGWVEQVFTII